MLTGLLLSAEAILRRTNAAAPGRATRILVLEYRLPLGCLVHMTPVFEAMKRSRPEIEITVATRGLGLQVLRHSPFVDRLVETPDPTTDLSGAVRALRKMLRSRGIRPDCVLTGGSDQRTRIALLGLLVSVLHAQNVRPGKLGRKGPLGAEGATEKLGSSVENGGKSPSVAKAGIHSVGVMRGLKPPPPSDGSFSAACKAQLVLCRFRHD